MDDICSDNYSPSVYKVKVWNDPNQVVIFVFVGSQPVKVKLALTHVEQKSKLSPESAEILSTIFGKSYKNKIGVHESCEVKMIYQTLYHDDTVGMARKKIVAYLLSEDSKAEDFYMWIDRSIIDHHIWSASTGIQLMRGKSKIRKGDFLSRMKDLKGMRSPPKNATKDADKELDLENVIDVIKACKMTTYTMPLEFRRVVEGYVLPGFSNPFKVSRDDSQKLDEADMVHESGGLLESFNIVKNTINIVRKSNIESGLHPFFFRSKPTVNPNDAEVIVAADTLCELYQKQRVIDRNKTGAAAGVKLETDCSISFLHLRFNESIGIPRISLGEVFARLQTGFGIILIKHNVAGQKQYKLHKDALSTLETSALNKWTEKPTTGKNASSGRTEYIMIKGLFDGNRYLTFLVFADFHVDVKFTSSKADNLKFANIKSAGFRCIDDIVLHIRNQVPEITNIFHGIKTLSLKIINLVSYIRMETSVKKVGLSHLKTFAAAMFPFVTIDTSNDKDNILMMSYKRINNYANNSNITVFLNRNYKLPDAELVKTLQDTFSVSHDVATTEVAKWRRTSKMAYYQVGQKLFLRPKDYNNITISISKTANGYVILIDGVTDVVYHQRIISLIRFLVLNAANDNVTDGFVKKSYDKLAFEAVVNDDDNIMTMDDAMSSISFSMDDDDVEDDIEDVFKGLFDLSIDSNADEADGIVGGAKVVDPVKQKTKMYVLSQLQKADPQLFENPYSRHCQAVNLRQPIVIDDDMKAAIDRSHPGSYNNYAVVPNSRSKKKNIYICPEIWCPVSKVSMTFQQFEKSAKRCPLPEEEPYNFSAEYFEGQEGQQNPRYVGYTGDCLPCCFKKSPDSGENLKKFKKCDDKGETPLSNPSPEPAQDASSVRYILGTQYPLDARRLGLLPKVVEHIFGNMVCGSGSKDTGFVTEATNCFVRKGISSESKTKYFMSCIAVIFDKTNEEILETIRENVDENMFLTLNGGKLCGQFVDKSRSVHDAEECKKFMSWMVHPKTLKTFKLDNALTELVNKLNLNLSRAKTIRFGEIDGSLQSSVLRLYVVYNAFTSFQAYLNDDKSFKVDDVFLDIVNRKTSWLNPKGINVIVIEASQDDAYLLCNHSVENTRPHHPYVFIVKQPTHIYEPIVRVTQGVKQQLFFERGDHPALDDIIGAYESSCGSHLKLEGANAYAIYTYLYSIKKRVRFQVLDYDLTLVGFVLQSSSGSLFVPLRKQPPMLDKPIGCIYVSDIIRFVPETVGDWEAAATTFRELHTLSKDSTYNVDAIYAEDEQQPVAFRTKDGVTIPLSKKNFQENQNMYLDNLNIFIGLQIPDPRTILVNDLESKEAVTQALKNAVVQAFAKNQDFSNLLESRNVDKLKDLISKLVKQLTIETDGMIKGTITPPCATRRKASCTGICILDSKDQCKIKVSPKLLEQFQGRILDILLKGRDTLAYPLGRPTSTAADEILFDQEDVNDGTLERLISRIKQPYAFLDKVLEEVVESRVKLYPIQKDIFTESWNDLPSPFKKGIKNFHINASDDRNLVMYLANSLSALKNYGVDFDRNSMFVIMKNNYIDLQRKNDNGIKAVADELSVTNSSFAYLWRNRTATSLDDIFDVLRSNDYWYGSNELQLLANALNVHFILLTRSTIRTPGGFRRINSVVDKDDYVFLWWTEVKDDSGKKTTHDLYQIISNKDLPKLIWNKSEVQDVLDYQPARNTYLQQL